MAKKKRVSTFDLNRDSVISASSLEHDAWTLVMMVAKREDSLRHVAEAERRKYRPKVRRSSRAMATRAVDKCKAQPFRSWGGALLLLTFSPL